MSGSPDQLSSGITLLHNPWSVLQLSFSFLSYLMPGFGFTHSGTEFLLVPDIASGTRHPMGEKVN
jgi:hypothetical protein